VSNLDPGGINGDYAILSFPLRLGSFAELSQLTLIGIMGFKSIPKTSFQVSEIRP
jgi:hypothetical protein